MTRRYQSTPYRPWYYHYDVPFQVPEGMSFLTEIFVLVSTFANNTSLVPGAPWFLCQPARDMNRFVCSFFVLVNEILTKTMTLVAKSEVWFFICGCTSQV